MMRYYVTKQDLWGLPKGHVERFDDRVAGKLLLDGAIEAFDAGRHGSLPGAENAAPRPAPLPAQTKVVQPIRK